MSVTQRNLIRESATKRQHAASAPETSAVALASAGSGKTRVLIGRAQRLLIAGARPDGLLCLTFTKAAAAEMKNRLSRDLAAWAALEDDALAAALAKVGAPTDEKAMATARRLFPKALEAPGGVKIQTVHAFCQSLLARFPIEAGVPPGFEALDDRGAQAAIAAAFRETVVDPELADAVGLLAAAGEGKLRDAVDGYLAERARLADAATDRDAAARRLAVHLDLPWPVPDEAGTIAAACAPETADADGLRRLAAALARGGTNDQKREPDAIAAWANADAAERIAAFDAHSRRFIVADAKTGLWTARKQLVSAKAQKTDPGVVEIDALEAGRIETVKRRCAAIRAYRRSLAALDVAAAVQGRYDAAKRRAARLDYDDLILKACAFLESDGGARWAHFKLDRGVEHILVDEAQDNNPDQWRVIDALAAPFFDGTDAAAGRRRRTLFIVGDRKQSIYGFQRAAPAALEAKVRQLEDWAAAAGQGPPPKPELDVSFRTTAAVLDLVDAVSDANRLSIGATRHQVDRIGAPGIVELWPPLAAQDADPPSPWTPPDPTTPAPARWEDRMAAVTARAIKRWVDERRPLADGRPVRWGDVLVLVRKRGRFAAAFAKACAAAEVPNAGADRVDLDRAMAAIALRAAARWIASPADDLALAILLKSPLFGFDEDRLFAAAHGRIGGLRAAIAERAGFGDVDAALAALEAAGRRDRPFELLTAALGARGRARLRAAYGADAEDPIDELLNLALDYERTHPPSLLGFLAWLDAGGAEVKRDPAAGAGDAVRLMTVHAAKGLEAPAVILIDGGEQQRADGLMWPLGDDGPALWRAAKKSGDVAPLGARAADDIQKAEDAESDRLLYVAMTRARDWLCVGGWPGRGGAPTRWRRQIAAGLDALDGVEDADFVDAYGLDDLAPFGEGGLLRRRQAGRPPPRADDPAPVKAEPTAPDWLFTPASPERAAPQLRAPSRIAGDAPDAASPTGDGAAARRRGVLIHALLEKLPDLAPERRRRAATGWIASRALDLPADARGEMVDAALGALDLPDAAPFFGPGGVAEAAIVGAAPGPNGDMPISGRIDRLRVDGKRAWLLDYKTDRLPPDANAPAPRAYAAQLALYAGAVAAALGDGAEVETALLWTSGPRLQRISPAARAAALDGLRAQA